MKTRTADLTDVTAPRFCDPPPLSPRSVHDRAGSSDATAPQSLPLMVLGVVCYGRVAVVVSRLMHPAVKAPMGRL